MERKCNVEISCDPCGRKQARIKAGKAWLRLDLKMKNGDELMVDGVDVRPPLSYPAPGSVIYFKEGKRHVLHGYESLGVTATTLCMDPKCDDPMCKIWQELCRLKAERGFKAFMKRVFRRKKKA